MTKIKFDVEWYRSGDGYSPIVKVIMNITGLVLEAPFSNVSPKSEWEKFYERLLSRRPCHLLCSKENFGAQFQGTTDKLYLHLGRCGGDISRNFVVSMNTDDGERIIKGLIDKFSYQTKSTDILESDVESLVVGKVQGKLESDVN